MAVEPSGREALDDLFWRSEILQAMFWMRGEDLADDIAPAALADFLMEEPATVADAMQKLASAGYLELVTQPDAPERYRLSQLGIDEGSRSFRDEFEEMLRPGHYQCSPGCSCLDPAHAGEPCPVHGGH